MARVGIAHHARLSISYQIERRRQQWSPGMPQNGMQITVELGQKPPGIACDRFQLLDQSPNHCSH